VRDVFSGCVTGVKVMLAAVWKPVAAIALGALVALGGVRAWKTLNESDHFLLKEVSVFPGDGPGAEEAAWLCGLRPGRDNLLFESESEIEKTCLEGPGIRFVDVDIRLPNKVVIRLEEQRPALFVATAFGMFGVDEYGEEMGPVDILDLKDIPLLTGLVGDSWESGLKDGVFEDALSLARTVSAGKGPWSGQGLVIEYDMDLGFSVRGTDSGMTARFGWSPFGGKHERLLKALNLVAGKHLDVKGALLDLDTRPDSVVLQTEIDHRIASTGNVIGPEMNTSVMEGRP